MRIHFAFSEYITQYKKAAQWAKVHLKVTCKLNRDDGVLCARFLLSSTSIKSAIWNVLANTIMAQIRAERSFRIRIYGGFGLGVRDFCSTSSSVKEKY